MPPLALAVLLGLSPVPAAHAAAAMTGQGPRVGEALARVCRRESRCSSSAGIHVEDAWLSRREWRGQVRLEHLDPDCQPYEPGAWATRGPFGLSAASHWAYLPDCYAPEILDLPIVSALVAAQKWEARCTARGRRPGWCRVGRRG